MNIYNYEDGKLVVTKRLTKSLQDVTDCISKSRPQKGIDATIAAYLPTLDPAQEQADLWYEQHLIVESADPNETGAIVPVLDGDGDYTYTNDGELITTIGLNAYEVALNERNKLEEVNPWLLSLRGVEGASTRPKFTMTVDEWKVSNASLFASYYKAKGTLINGHLLSLNKDNADGLVSIEVAYKLAGDAIFPTNFVADTFDGIKPIPLTSYNDYLALAMPFLAARGELFK